VTPSPGAPRTLVISDLHLGARTARDVLTAPRPRGLLLEALDQVDRLVLLGDLVELRHGPVRDVLAVAEPVLRDVSDALGPDAEVVIVPGNHDHHLVEPWLERRARGAEPAPLRIELQGGEAAPLGLESAVTWRPGEALSQIAGWLGADRVRAAYPGVWLRDDVYAMHGHYGDRHTTVPMFERLAAGAMARIVHEPDGGPHRAEDYESVLAPLYAWIHAVAQYGGPDLGASAHGASAVAWRALAGTHGRPTLRRRARRRALAAAFPAFVLALRRAGLGQLRADISGPELRRAALRATGEVLIRLGVAADHVVFGHTHRAGPQPDDDPHEFSAPTGARLHNTGSWVYEPSFVGGGGAPGPYWPGHAIALEGSAPPELRSLLDGLEAEAVRRRPQG
jgi:predicted phosphodiesterase